MNYNKIDNINNCLSANYCYRLWNDCSIVLQYSQ